VVSAKGNSTRGTPNRWLHTTSLLLSGVTTMRRALHGELDEPEVDLILRILTGGLK
jgi:hypothetical protein